MSIYFTIARCYSQEADLTSFAAAFELSCTMLVDPAQYSEYVSLEEGQIRLLTLQQGSNQDDPIECELSSCELENAPSYEALFYFWGTNQNTRVILLRESTFRVREDLYNALCRLRQRETNRILWVDFICINQRNQAEIYDQVLRLGAIYACGYI